MPDLTITLTVPQLNRLRRALAILNADRSDASEVQVRGWLLDRLRAEVLRHETQTEGAAADAKARATLQAEGW